MQNAPIVINCRQLVELVTDYLEAALPSELNEVCELHLSDCPGCADYLRQMRRIIALLGEFIDRSVEPTARRELIAQFRAWRAANARGIQ